jgi:glycosyltransferase involved in cell wall biosynthesis
MKKPDTILIISESANFPWGMASANRVRNLAKGLLAKHFVVEYWGVRGAKVEPSKDKNNKGVYDGIKYFYPGGSPVRSSNWLNRRLDDLLSNCLSVIHTLIYKITGRLDLVIIYSRSHLMVSFWCSFMHLLHIPVVLEVCEWPLAKARTKIEVRDAEKYCFNAVLKVDAVLPISTYIDNEIRMIAESKNKNIPSFLIPILIDIDPDKLPPKQKPGEQYLLYSGFIGYMEIARLVVDTVHELKNRGFNLHLKFTGGGEGESLFDELKQYASENGVLHQIEFTGFVEENLLHELMRGALTLLAPLPQDLQTEARFSTKIGYYLASGRPVVTNAVGDVSLYLQDGVNAFLAKKFDSYEIATKIEQIINNPTHAEEVGRNGQKLAMEKFHYVAACRGLNDFLQQIIGNYR